MAILDKRATKVYPVISEMRKYSAQNNDSCTVTGLTSIGDGQGGDFVFDHYSELADDGISVIAPTGLAQGRWIRVYNIVPPATAPNHPVPLEQMQEAIGEKIDKTENIQAMWTGTQAEYDALTPDPETLYFIQ